MNDLSGMNYFGGKSRPQIREWLNGLIPHRPEGLYCEPFAGMLGLLLSRPKAKNEVVNDLESDIVNFWRVVGDTKKYRHLERMVKYTHHSKELYGEAMDIITGKEEADDVKTAWALYVALHHGVSHTLTGQGWGAVYKSHSTHPGGHAFARKIETLHQRMKNVQLHNCDAVDFLDRIAQYDAATVYCDPPYHTATSGYKVALDVEAFTAALKKQCGRCAISGYGDEWDHLGWHKVEKKIYFSHFGSAAKRKNEGRTECLWLNYPPCVQQTLF